MNSVQHNELSTTSFPPFPKGVVPDNVTDIFVSGDLCDVIISIPDTGGTICTRNHARWQP